MDFSKQRLSLDKAKEIDLVDYLLALGHEPLKIRNSDYWYLSPLRVENNPSFKVNRKLNRWYDHGLGRGGNLIDFGIEYHHCTIGELMEQLNSNLSFQQPVLPPVPINPPSEHKIRVLNNFPITSRSLIQYLEQRGIPIAIADKYCQEIRYELNNKVYYGIGFKNDSGGFELRNPYSKASCSPKDMTTFKNGSQEAAVFEGFTDFLSFQAIHENLPENSPDFVILNSLSFFEKARPFMEKHTSIQLYLDKDTAGRIVTQRALGLSSKYTDQSDFYKGHKDLNDWLVKSAKSQKRAIRQRIR